MLSMIPKQTSASLVQRTAGMGVRALSSSTASPIKQENIGTMRFTDETAKQVMDDATYAAYQSAMWDGTELDKAQKNSIAAALLDWSTGKGAVQYAHWFHPMRGALAGVKCDAFIDLDFSNLEGGKVLGEKLSGGLLFQGETDGSSFPNGGLRATHTAAAYNTWDMKSAPFVRGDTLYVPSAFISWRGHALDSKTVLLRSQEAISKQSVRLLDNLGENKAKRVNSNVGWEQEFFLIDQEDFVNRPDLLAAGRTLLGAEPPRGQQTDANYFSRIQPRVKAFFEDLQAELLATNIPCIVYHNEVAPSQHEFSPIFSLTNRAADDNCLSMEMMHDIAANHGLACLNHEKPFANLNGSGKHSNWGLNTDDGKNLYVVGKTDEDQAQFMAQVAVLARTVKTHGDLLRTSVASAGNDHRLGAQEAPPAILSLYTGVQMEEHIRAIMAGGELAGYAGAEGGKPISYGAASTQDIEGGFEDRNRTAPFPFCGNRFEFRAVGSNQSIAIPMAYLNTAVAESQAVLSADIESGTPVRDAVAKMFNENIEAIFNGNGYDEAWHKEAEEERGLCNLRNTPAALDTLNSAKNKALFESQGVLSGEELDARQEIAQEEYIATINLEAECMLNMLNQGVLPAAAEDASKMTAAGLGAKRTAMYAALEEATNKLDDVLANFPENDDLSAQSHYCADVVKAAMDEAREHSDACERVISSELFPYPTYENMLFSHHYDASI
jgi:glutamine synthetase